jgi:hypothetical protein
MGLFNIDIEKYYKEQIDQGNQLMGMFCIQYPIYCIHANISDVTPDPMDNMDRVIVEFIKTKPDFSPIQISSLLGTSRKLVEMRLEELISDDLIEKKGKSYSLNDNGINVFNEKIKKRQHKRSFDFYIDGITLKPLPEIFYGYYRYEYLSEHEFYYRTAKKTGEQILVCPFGPDLVHTPPDKERISESILAISEDERSRFHVPLGLESIDDLSYTKLTLQLLVAVTKNNGEIKKELIDPFAFYSLAENISYTEALKQHIRIFEPRLKEKIANLEFRLTIPRKRENEAADPKPILTTNWPEIDKYKESQSKCFNFAKDDLVKAIMVMYELPSLDPESLISSDTELEININKKTLLDSSNRSKLINDLLRKRDYRHGNVDNNVFILYIQYKTSDDYVIQIMKFKELVNLAKRNGKTDLDWLVSHLPEFSIEFRELCVSSGEIELLEIYDIDTFMVKII